MSPEISVVIVNYNVKQLLLDCLTSLYRSDIKDMLEIIVVDNDSSDGSVGAIKDKFPLIKLIDNHYNAGFPAANNQGFRMATGKYIFMLNPDTEVFLDTISLLRNYMETHAEVAIVGPRLLNSDNSLQYSAWRFPKSTYILGESFYLKFLYADKNYPDKDLRQPTDVDSISGAAIFFRRELLDRVGYLDEKLFWIEDVDFCYRTRKCDEKIVYIPNAKVVHHSGQSAKKNYTISISNQVFNKIKFYRKHHGYLKTLMIKWISLLHVLFKILLFLILSPIRSVYFRKFKAYIYTLPKIFNPPDGIK